VLVVGEPGVGKTHVQHILTKLGLSNRTQIATWVAGLRTTDT
jgi:DNA-binding NarL/FixJ family response regulator